MNTFYKILALIGLVIIIYACGSKMNYNEMIAYIDDPDNGFVQEKTINNITYRVSYRPTELLIAQETRTKQNMLSDEIHELFEKYNNQHYFVFSISKGTSEVQYSSANQNEYA